MTNVIEIGTKFFVEISNDSTGQPCAKLVQHTPKAKRGEAKTLKNYRFRNEENRNNWVNSVVAEITKKESEKNSRKEAVKAATKAAIINIGDIFSHSWGWEQTNIQFYQVISVKGQTIQLQEVRQNRVQNGFMSGTCTPIVGEFLNEQPFTKRVKCLSCGKVYISTEFGWAQLWDGTPENWTAYA